MFICVGTIFSLIIDKIEGLIMCGFISPIVVQNSCIFLSINKQMAHDKQHKHIHLIWHQIQIYQKK